MIKRCKNKSSSHTSPSAEQMFVIGTQGASPDPPQQQPVAQIPQPVETVSADSNIYNRLNRGPCLNQAFYDNVRDSPPAVPARKQLPTTVSEARGSSGQTSFVMSTLDSCRRCSSSADTQGDVSLQNVRTGAVLIPAPVIPKENRTFPESVSKEEKVTEDQQQTSAFDAGYTTQEVNNVQQPDSNVTQKGSDGRPSKATTPSSVEVNELPHNSNTPVNVLTRQESCDSTVLDPDNNIICIDV